MERQHLVFIIVAAGLFSALIIIGVYFNPLKAGSDSNGTGDKDVIKAKIGNKVDIRYSANVVGLIKNLPARNNLTLEVSSELQNTNLAGLLGELRYSNEIITYVQNGKVESVTDDTFKTIQYRFSPDAGNKTKYSFENVKFISESKDSQLVASFIPLDTAKVGDHYTVKIILDTGGIVKYAVGEKTIEIVQ